MIPSSYGQYVRKCIHVSFILLKEKLSKSDNL